MSKQLLKRRLSELNLGIEISNKSDRCIDCDCLLIGVIPTDEYHKIDEGYICNNCKDKRDGILPYINPKSAVWKGTVAELIVEEALDITENYNTTHKFNHKYDLYKKELGTINVKSINNYNTMWTFDMLQKHIPDTYIFVAFNEDRSIIEHVWIIPSNAKIIKNKTKLIVSNTTISEVLKFEDNIDKYNKAKAVVNKKERTLKRFVK